MTGRQATASGGAAPLRKRTAPTTVHFLTHDILCMVFSFLDLLDLARCSGVCKFWNVTIANSKLLHTLLSKQDKSSVSLSDVSSSSGGLLKISLQELAMDRHRLSLQEGAANIFQWRGHSIGIDQCRMKTGLILTGVGDKVMRLWSSESCRFLDEFGLPDRAPLVDFDFDEAKVVGLVGTRICIWRRNGKRNIVSSREGLFTKGLCMRYVDPGAVVGCEDGTVRVFDMYSRSCSQIIKMHSGTVTCLALSDDQLIVSGSSLGGVTLSDLSSDQQVAALRPTNSGGIRSLSLNPCSHLVFAGTTAGYVTCWDFRMGKALWNNRVSPNVIYSMNHMRSDNSTLAVGGIDGVLRILDQETGEVLSRCIMDYDSSSSSRISVNSRVQVHKARRLSEDDRIDVIPRGYRPAIRCLAVGMERIVTTHNQKHITLWKFSR
ncbi:F-box/WD-40 repeat-containing protein At3g52030 isoform X1 [Diospyros lotus]|uniref:F-box/WD-40 repeat-containing protein At3g52030 isoform X1 n=1 Tax=Diospyros lotus TaxID=55363 RepID=UPI0022501BDC|nr:F-box/WD-40 repeat-containing protein At3g52030 isoform X1 [Diospyros lotus]